MAASSKVDDTCGRQIHRNASRNLRVSSFFKISSSNNDHSGMQRRTHSQREEALDDQALPSKRPKRSEMCGEDYQRILRQYERLPLSSSGRHQGANALCKKWNISSQTLANIVARDQDPERHGRLSPLPRPGRPTVVTPTKIKAMYNIVMKNQGFASVRKVSRCLLHTGKSSKGMSFSTVRRCFKKPEWRMALRATRPSLTPDQKKKRVAFALKHLEDNNEAHVEIDEKWFYGGSLNGRIHVPKGMLAHRRPVRSKRFIPKVLVITAVAKPNATYNFDGRIGFWPVVANYQARRSSIYHARGEVYQKTTTLNAAKFERFIAHFVAPKIRRVMPWCDEITIQLDNAPPHSRTAHIAKLINKQRSDRHIKLTFVKQPPQSPDTNVNDLGLYHSLQRCIDLGGLPLHTTSNVLTGVRFAWRKLTAATLDSLFRVKQRVLRKIVELEGSNEFIVPHSV